MDIASRYRKARDHATCRETVGTHALSAVGAGNWRVAVIKGQRVNFDVGNQPSLGCRRSYLMADFDVIKIDGLI